MDKIKVSVVVPVYNVEEYIEECLESIIQQELKDIEIIVVNDGTKDRSMERIERFLKDPRVKVINKKNEGVASARNTGIQKAAGEYIAFVDSDDFIHPSMYKEMYEKAQGAEVVICGVVEVESSTGIRKNRKIKKEIVSQRWGSYFWEYSGLEVWNKLYKLDFLREKHLRFKKGMVYEDVPFNFQILFFSKKVKYVEGNFYYYRVNRLGSCLNLQNDAKKLEALKQVNRALNRVNTDKIKDIFSRKRAYLWKMHYFSKMLKYEKKKIPIDVIQRFETELKRDYFQMTLLEKEIIQEDVQDLFRGRMFFEINIFDSFYWKNRLFEKKGFRRIIAEKIKNFFKRGLLYKG